MRSEFDPAPRRPSTRGERLGVAAFALLLGGLVVAELLSDFTPRKLSMLFVIAFWWLDLDPFWAACAVILAALPLGALTFVLAQQYQVYIQRAAAAILISTVVSVATLSALMAYLGVQ